MAKRALKKSVSHDCDDKHQVRSRGLIRSDDAELVVGNTYHVQWGRPSEMDTAVVLAEGSEKEMRARLKAVASSTRTEPLPALEPAVTVTPPPPKRPKKSPLGKLVKVNKQKDVKEFPTATTSQSHVNLAAAKISKLPSINIKSTGEMPGCWITGAILLSPTRLIVVDCLRGNQSVKDVDLTSNTITSRLQLPSYPYDITALPEQQAAVTLPYKSQIQVISAKGDLSPSHTIKVNGQCEGIDSTPEKLFVSYLNPGKVEVMDHHGMVLQSIISDGHSKPLFESPYYLAVTYEDHQEVMYVSDWHTNTITKLTIRGEVLYTYRDIDLSRPRGITVTDNGDLLICNRNKHNVHLVSGRTGEKIRTLITSRQWIFEPQTVCYCTVQNKLYVGQNVNNYVKVFKLT